jgi:hypothetical protein
MSTITRDNAFQYDSILETELSRKWISVFRTRVRDRFYECKVVKLISIHPVVSSKLRYILASCRERLMVGLCWRLLIGQRK